MTPELQQADLDPATLEHLFSDLTQHVQVLGISAKDGATAYAGQDSLDLRTAHAALITRAVRGVQIRYRYQDEEWWDTLLVLERTVRLVRTRPNFNDCTA